MGIKCSLMGHRFDETTVERDREEEGTEVVITIRETETCARCGETRVVSENKEVTTLETPDGPSADDSEAEDEETADEVEADVEPADAGAEIIDGDEDDAPADVEADAETDVEPVEAEADAEDDDAVILDDEGDETDAQAEARGTQASIPDAESGDEPADAGADADAEEDDAVIIDDAGAADETDSEDPDDGDDPAAWPQEDEAGETEDDAVPNLSAERTSEWPDDDEPEIGTNAGGVAHEAPSEPMEEWPDDPSREGPSDVASGPTLEPTEGASVTVPEGKFKCSECGFETEVESSSLRAGDFCPECHRGTLLQREDEAE